MHKAILLIAFSIMVAWRQTPAAGGPFGAGIFIGDPTAISLKYKLSGSSALDGGLGYDFRGRRDHLTVHGNYLFIFKEPFAIDLPNYFLYPGVGVAVGAGNGDVGMGVRFPLGAGIEVAQIMEFFLEIVPVMALIPGTDLNFDGGLGFRFFF